jgi:hypothetical protein
MKTFKISIVWPGKSLNVLSCWPGQIYILIYLANYFILTFLETKFLFTLLWNLMLIFVQFNFNFSHVSDIVQTDYWSIIDIFDMDHQQYTDLLMCSILLIMIIFTHNNNIFFTLCRVQKKKKMFTMRAGQMPTYFINHNEFHSTLTWIMWSLLLIWSLPLQFD